jgi:hypothetical protein
VIHKIDNKNEKNKQTDGAMNYPYHFSLLSSFLKKK